MLLGPGEEGVMRTTEWVQVYFLDVENALAPDRHNVTHHKCKL